MPAPITTACADEGKLVLKPPFASATEIHYSYLSSFLSAPERDERTRNVDTDGDGSSVAFSDLGQRPPSEYG